MRFRGKHINVIGQCEGDDIGLESVDDRTGLCARTAMREADLHIHAGLGFPILRERRVIALVKLASGVVRDVEEFDRPGSLKACRCESGNEKKLVHDILSKFGSDLDAASLLRRPATRGSPALYIGESARCLSRKGRRWK